MGKAQRAHQSQSVPVATGFRLLLILSKILLGLNPGPANWPDLDGYPNNGFALINQMLVLACNKSFAEILLSICRPKIAE
jgi:hypothetical protein